MHHCYDLENNSPGNEFCVSTGLQLSESNWKTKRGFGRGLLIIGLENFDASVFYLLQSTDIQ